MYKFIWCLCIAESSHLELKDNIESLSKAWALVKNVLKEQGMVNINFIF